MTVTLKKKRAFFTFSPAFLHPLYASSSPLFLSCPPSSSGLLLNTFMHSFLLLNCSSTHSQHSFFLLIYPQRHFNPLISSAVFFPPPPPFNPGKAHPFIVVFPSFLAAHSPPTSFRLFLSCAKGNHPWKMFWPSVIAASRMFPISLMPEPRAC